MVIAKPCLAAALMAMLSVQTVPFAHAQQLRTQKNEQDIVRLNFQRGTIQSLKQIESIVVPAMVRRGAQYIGANFDSSQMRYRLKFIRQASVIFIDVDGRSGQIVAQSGN
jgi:hypothetical protein